ncbi:hypothetical protein MMC13_000776 [Lambiella insularis]|nr:hypothetical protein [Lambiella insularis]
MPKTFTTALTFYPAYCFSSSPTFNTWTKLTAADVHALKEREGFEGQKTYFHLNHPIRWVRLVGVIVAFDATDYRWILHLDDSSGATIEVTCPRERMPLSKSTTVDATVPAANTGSSGYNCKARTLTGVEIDLSNIDVGSVVKVKGGVGVFRGEKQITLERISIIRSTTEEAVAWKELHVFRSNVLSIPWSITAEEERKLKEEADGTKLRAEEKLRRRAHREAKELKRKQREALRRVTNPKRRISDKENEIE